MIEIGFIFAALITITAISVMLLSSMRSRQRLAEIKALNARRSDSDRESMERIKLLSTENAQLRAELGSVKDRLETIERIVTDQPQRLAREIDALAIDHGGHA